MRKSPINRERFGVDRGEMGNKIDLRRDGTRWMLFATWHVDWLHRYTVVHKMPINNTYLMAYFDQAIPVALPTLGAKSEHAQPHRTNVFASSLRTPANATARPLWARISRVFICRALLSRAPSMRRRACFAKARRKERAGVLDEFVCFGRAKLKIKKKKNSASQKHETVHRAQL